MMADRLIGGLDIDTYTDAPLRVHRAAFLDAPPRLIFSVISDHANSDSWLPLVDQVNVSRGHAAVRDGEGTIRYVHYGIFRTQREYIIAFYPPHLIAYSIEGSALFNDHVSVMYLEPERHGGTTLIWQHYFRAGWLPWLTDPVLPVILYALCGAALRHLVVYFGGRLE